MNKQDLRKFISEHTDNYSILLRVHHREVFDEINKLYNFDHFGQKLYHYIHGDDIGKCEICGGICKFDGVHKGYRKRCSYKCMGASKIKSSHECRKCIVCGKQFEVYKIQKKTTCSAGCLLELNKSEEVNVRRQKTLRKTMVDIYGVDHASKLPDFKIKLKRTKLERYGDENYVNVEKCKKTKLKRYGSENYVNDKKSKETKLKKYNDENYNNRKRFVETNLSRFGVPYPIQNEDIKIKQQQTFNDRYGGCGYSSSSLNKKITKTNIIRYGVPHVMKNKNIAEKSRQVMLDEYRTGIFEGNRLNGEVIPLFDKKDYNGSNFKYPFKCVKCNSDFISKVDDGKVPKCPICYPYVQSKGEEDIYQFIKSILPDVEILRNTRSVLMSGKELDIYIPSKRFAFEYNGIYWHSEVSGGKDKKYHVNKTNECELLGIRLIHIMEDEWVEKQEIIKRKICHLLGVTYVDINKKSEFFEDLTADKSNVYARECSISEIDSKTKSKFLNEYHIQGNDMSAIKLGAFYNNELVAVMTFGKRRVAMGKKSTEDGEYELLRFCVGDRNVVGIAGKLFKHFIKLINPNKITSYADRRYSDKGAFYGKIGFNLIGETMPNYWYFHNDKPLYLLHRFNFRKDQLSKKLEKFDPELTEWENMVNNGYDRMWDCGNLRYEWVKEKNDKVTV